MNNELKVGDIIKHNQYSIEGEVISISDDRQVLVQFNNGQTGTFDEAILLNNYHVVN